MRACPSHTGPTRCSRWQTMPSCCSMPSASTVRTFLQPGSARWPPAVCACYARGGWCVTTGVHVCGASMGGMIAQLVLTGYPERVRRHATTTTASLHVLTERLLAERSSFHDRAHSRRLSWRDGQLLQRAWTASTCLPACLPAWRGLAMIGSLTAGCVCSLSTAQRHHHVLVPRAVERSSATLHTFLPLLRLSGAATQ
jgi:pimeloyl-ACP methyl ester carboxylesterase